MLTSECYHYILDEQGNPVPEYNTLVWGKWFEENINNRRVGNTSFGDINVSTVFLSVVHQSNTNLENDRPMLYETMVFASEDIIKRLLELSERDDRSIIASIFGGFDIQRRYATKTEAQAGHEQMCVFIETCMSNGLLEGTGANYVD